MVNVLVRLVLSTGITAVGRGEIGLKVERGLMELGVRIRDGPVGKHDKH